MAASSIYIGCSEANYLISCQREKCFHHIYLERNLDLKKEITSFLLIYLEHLKYFS